MCYIWSNFERTLWHLADKVIDRFHRWHNFFLRSIWYAIYTHQTSIVYPKQLLTIQRKVSINAKKLKPNHKRRRERGATQLRIHVLVKWWEIMELKSIRSLKFFIVHVLRFYPQSSVFWSSWEQSCHLWARGIWRRVLGAAWPPLTSCSPGAKVNT